MPHFTNTDLARLHVDRIKKENEKLHEDAVKKLGGEVTALMRELINQEATDIEKRELIIAYTKELSNQGKREFIPIFINALQLALKKSNIQVNLRKLFPSRASEKKISLDEQLKNASHYWRNLPEIPEPTALPRKDQAKVLLTVLSLKLENGQLAISAERKRLASSIAKEWKFIRDMQKKNTLAFNLLKSVDILQNHIENNLELAQRILNLTPLDKTATREEREKELKSLQRIHRIIERTRASYLKKIGALTLPLTTINKALNKYAQVFPRDIILLLGRTVESKYSQLAKKIFIAETLGPVKEDLQFSAFTEIMKRDKALQGVIPKQRILNKAIKTLEHLLRQGK